MRPAARGVDRPLNVLPFDHRGSFESGLFGWKGALGPEQSARIAESKQVIYDAPGGSESRRLHRPRPRRRREAGRDWLATAASVPGFIGFAVGRTTFWDPLVSWRDGHASRDEAAAEIARRYRRWCEVFETGRAGSPLS